jgi:hypothetical protein
MSTDAAALAPIQMLWVRGRLSRLELLSLRSFLAQGHPVHLYTYDAPDNLPAGVQVRDAAAIVPADLAPLRPAAPFAAGSLGAFSDYFRYHLLLTHGGWWSDLDVVCLRPWRFTAPALTASTAELNFGHKANGYVLRFPAGHPVIRACVQDLDSAELATLGIDRTGPLLLNRVLHEQGQVSLMLHPAVFGPVPWNASFQLVRSWPERLSLDELKQRLRRPHLSVRSTRDTVAVHLWNETWRHAGRDKNAVYAASCLYERLQRRFNPTPA